MSAPVQGAGPRVLVVEDTASMAEVMRYNLAEEGCRVTLATRADQALELLRAAGQAGAEGFDLVLTDVKLPGGDGLQVLAAARAALPAAPVVLVTAFGSVEQAVEALAAGAADYITKPFRRPEFKARIARALEQAALRRENRSLKERIDQAAELELVTASPRVQEVLRVIDRVAASDTSVLLLGESGTGKELLAKRLHARSPRAAGPFVPINCAALPGELLESELLGHERGAFTGADRARAGRFEQASGGTLFLDEIGELPLALQAKILRVLEEGVVDRLGGQRRIEVDVRVVAATHRDLQAEAEAGRFRPDLFHRLSVVPVRIPPLRERPEDIQLLARHFLEQAAKGTAVGLAPALLQELGRLPWPGNVRELKNLVQRMVLLRRSDVLDLADLAPPGSVGGARPAEPARPAIAPAPAGSSPDAPLVPGQLALPAQGFSLPALEREIVLKALELHSGNRSATARYLGVPRHVLIYRLEKYGL
ncbi:MAG TPA: sigma-54 dependent transcriptional regulator [Myxococcota bacterium]|nr:sigma-54 dependent transcriptional regulator [Myxococcota bacterium]HRY95678.1 sigma-54 dependent transcriptional regulator [Myxococcota bacterium]